MHAVILYCTSGSFLPLYSLSLSLHVLFLFGWTSRCPCKLAPCSLNKGMKETDWPWSSGGIPHAHGASTGPISPSLAYLSSNALNTRVITSSEPGLPGFLISCFLIIMNCSNVVLFCLLVCLCVIAQVAHRIPCVRTLWRIFIIRAAEVFTTYVVQHLYLAAVLGL